MRALGITLVEHGGDFQKSREHALRLATERGAHMVPSYHPDLLRGVTPCWWEFLCAMPPLDMVYMPIGQGSGAGSAIAAKRAPGHSVRIVGVVSAPATTCADSIAAAMSLRPRWTPSWPTAWPADWPTLPGRNARK